jgi:hypothetical protein
MKAPRWLTESFMEGIDERELVIAELDECEPCWLAQFDRGARPCEGRFERFHFINRQRVEHALALSLSCLIEDGPESHIWFVSPAADADLIHLAAWDSRNGGIACEAHHRRFDKHLVSVPSEQVVVPYSVLPEHVLEFASDWGLEDELADKFPDLLIDSPTERKD